MNGRLDWEDLHTILAVAETGSLAAAARRLGVNHTTVLRRVGGFEQRLGLRLFDRLPGGYALTAGGEEMVAAARGMAATVETLERRLAGQDLRLDGTLRVATADTLMGSILPPLLAQFRDLHPGIGLEVTTANLLANLTRRDADVAIRPVLDPPETLVGRRIAAVAFAVYAAAGHAAGPDDLARRPWVAPDDSLAGSTVARWMRQAVPGATVALRTDSLVGMCRAALAGLGLAALPCYLGDSAPGLVRIPVPSVPDSTALWVLTHEDLRRTARVSAFTEFMAAALARQRDLLEGRRPAIA